MRRVSKYIGWVNGQTCHFWVRSKLDVTHIFCQCDFSQMLHLIVVLLQPTPSLSIAHLEMSVWPMEVHTLRAEWKCALEISGAPYATIHGTTEMLVWFASNCLIHRSVGYFLLYICASCADKLFWNYFRWSCHQWVQIWCWWHASCYWKPQLQWHWGQSNQLLHYLIRQECHK